MHNLCIVFFLLQCNLMKRRRCACFFCFFFKLPLTQLISTKHNILCSCVVHLCVVLCVVCVFGKCKHEREEGLMPPIRKPQLNL
jgi:hypothetical protein